MPTKQRNQLTSRAAVTLRALAPSDGQAPAKTKRFSLVAYTGEPLEQCWSDAPIVVDLAGLDLTGAAIPILYDHMDFADCIVGQAEKVSISNGQVIVEGPFIEVNEAAKLIAKLAAAGYKFQASIGADIQAKEFVAAGATVNVNGRDYAGPVYVARKTVLREISFVVLGADRKTSALVARRKIRGGVMPSFDDFVAQMATLLGVDPSTLDETQTAGMQLAYQQYVGGEDEGDSDEDVDAATGDGADNDTEEETPAATTPPTPTPAAASSPPVQVKAKSPPVAVPINPANFIAAQRAEAARQTQINFLCAHNPTHWVRARKGGPLQEVSLAAHAIAKGWTTEQVKDVLDRQTKVNEMRAKQPQAGPFLVSRSHEKDCTLQALQGALLLRAGRPLDAKVYASSHPGAQAFPVWLRASVNDDARQRFMEAAHGYAQMSLVDVARESLRLAGKNIPVNRSSMIQAAFSGGTLSSIFTTNVNTILVATYLEGPDTTATWTREVDVNDFKLNERPRMTKGGGLKLLPPGGTADHITRSDVGESYKAKRYAAQWQIDEQNMIDDSFDALGDSPREMGLAAARLRPDLVYAHLMSNPTLAATTRALFNATDGNLKTGSALSAATIKTAIATMKLFRENSVNLNIEPTHLVAPPTVSWTARELLNSTMNVIAGTAGSITERGDSNVLKGLLQPVEEARLENGVIDPVTESLQAGSASTWYVVSTRIPTIEVAYLRGSGRSPTVRSWLLERGAYGVGWDVMLDIGVKAMDWRSMVKCTA